MKKLIATLAFAGIAFNSNAQQVRPASSREIYHEIAQLKNLVNVLYLAAHPDDENTRLLAWLVNDQHVRTAYLSLTRGDGGQNILGNEQGAALGLIRTYELMEARKLDGAEQYFTRAIDFGFSKNSDETFKHWNKELLTGDVVWIYRKFRPDVVICRFPPNANAGHGQHAASAILAEEAYKVSGDKTRYADQLQYYKAWKPKRVIFNAFRFGDRNTTSEDMLKLSVGQYSPTLGMGYGELAGISRSIHRSQGAGTPSTPGVQTEYFKLVAGDSISQSLFDGIDITWGRVDRPEIGEHIQAVLDDFDFNNPNKSLAALIELRKEIESVSNKYWKAQKLKELDEAILHCSGFMAEVFTKQPEATRGETLDFTLRVISRGDVKINSVHWLNGDTVMNKQMGRDSLLSFEHKMQIPDDAAYTEPYWLRKASKDNAHFEIDGYTELGDPVTPNKLNITIDIAIAGTPLSVSAPLSYKKLDPTHGDVIEQLRIVPNAAVEFTSSVTLEEKTGTIYPSARLHSFKDTDDNRLVYTRDTDKYTLVLGLSKGLDTPVIFPIWASDANKKERQDFSLYASINSIPLTQHIIKYDHIPTLQYFTVAETKVINPNWQCKARRIGYIPGAGDKVADILQLTGLQVDILKESDITTEKLKKYDAVVTGVRVINVEKRMNNWIHTLNEYAKNGGTVVMQYNTLQDMATKELGPYPITLSGSRVTEEDAKVNFIDPKHKLLNYPNKITNADFEGWIQERGLYFASKWDEHYTPLFRMNDTGEQPLDGSTLYMKYGKGHYIYTSLAFFRQLPAGNKGAIRLLMNMLSVGK